MEPKNQIQIRYVPLVSVLLRQSTEEQLLIVENNTALLTDLMKYTQYQVKFLQLSIELDCL